MFDIFSMAPNTLFLKDVPFLTLTLKIPLYFSIFFKEVFLRFVCIKVVFENCSFLISKKFIQNILISLFSFLKSGFWKNHIFTPKTKR